MKAAQVSLPCKVIDETKVEEASPPITSVFEH